MGRTVEEQKGRILPREDFNLMKFKLTKDGAVITHHLAGTQPQDVTAVVDVKPHPDLQKAMDQLKLYMATRLGLLGGWDFAREHLKKNPNYLQKAIAGHESAKDVCNVNGLTFLGEGETAGVSITGSIKTPKSGSVGLAVPKITFGKEDLGYEEDVLQITKEITDEVYNYLILRKKEQTDVVDQSEGFDNTGGQMSIDDGILEVSQSEIDSFDENGERDFVPSEEQMEKTKDVSGEEE